MHAGAMMLMLPYSSRSGVADHGLAGRNGRDLEGRRDALGRARKKYARRDDWEWARSERYEESATRFGVRVGCGAWAFEAIFEEC